MAQIYTHWDNSFETLHRDIQELSTVALRMVGLAYPPPANNEVEPITQMEQMESVADRHYAEVRKRCAALVASASPLVKDLRLIAGAMQSATDLERIADEALEIAHAVRSLSVHLSPNVEAALVKMSRQVYSMVEYAITAFFHADLARAEEVGRMDDAVDEIYLRLLHGEHEGVREAVMDRQAVVHSVIVAHALERIADHATNVAEWAVYLQSGEFISLNGN